MTDDQQEARSHVALGHWVVGLSSGKLAVFDHPTDWQERCIIGSWTELMELEPRKTDIRVFVRKAANVMSLNLEGIDL